ncbi:hypothetical protein FI667_g17154, partial [Globisporangium splendens]
MATDEERVEYLRSLVSVREGCQRVYALAKEDKLPNFTVAFDKIPGVADYVINVIRQSYPDDITAVPFHSRYTCLESMASFRNGEPRARGKGATFLFKASMTATWDCDALEKARRLIDLALVSVLLDAGAGPTWKFKEPNTEDYYSRSEGLGIASLHMFLQGAFSSDLLNPHRSDADALSNLPSDAIAKAFQVDDETNPMVGCAGRTDLLKKLGGSLTAHPEFFAGADGSIRPGNLVDYLLKHKNDQNEVSVKELWRTVVYGLQDIWPDSRPSIGGQNMGDIWELSYLPEHEKASKYVCFHKLSQWLTYSLMEPLQEYGLKIIDLGLMTGLPEYRNGGLLVDFGVLVPKDSKTLTDEFDPSSEMIVEWRALTVAILDEVHKIVLERLNFTAEFFPLMLEGGSWKAGRVIAKEKRADGGPPITIKSDGTVF